MHHFLIHKRGDQVGIATTDIAAGQQAIGVFMDDNPEITVTSLHDVPLGHKISIGELKDGGKVIEYGIPIGIAPGGLTMGEFVHTHNIKSARW